MITREQRYASKAYPKVEQQVGATSQADYGSMALKLPVLIRKAGLAQALAFVESRGKEGHQQLLRDLADVTGTPDLVSQSRSAQLADYTRLTQMSLDALVWFKRFSQSLLDADASKEESHGG